MKLMSYKEGYKMLLGCNKKHKAVIDKGFPKIEELMDFPIIFERLQQINNSESRVKLYLDIDNPDIKPELFCLEDYKKQC